MQQNLTTSRDHIDTLIIWTRMRRMGITAAFLARRHRVSRPSITRALQGRPSHRRLLGRIANSLDVIERKRMTALPATLKGAEAAAKTLRTIENAKYERRAG